MDPAGIIITSIVGLVLILVGYLIWFKKMLFLIAGYNESTFEGDKEKLAKATGIVCMIIGIVTILFPFFLYYFGNIAGGIFCLVAVIGIAAVFWAKRKR